ncbi:MAG: hypothetical protein C4524_01500 [Candidatus Zixiibacteriota bacterium]|nr:MAG: hypothetical protein C4524_01500 [candidate division Zixibacteria bacterium]
MLGLAVFMPRPAAAHCDTLDGPVIMDARAALDNGDAAPVLKWVGPDKEAEIRQAFDLARSVRQQGGQARGLADRYFFETLVRVHREGEGAPYTGLKPAGTVEPGIAAADQALEGGAVDPVVEEVTAGVAQGLRDRYRKVMEARQHATHNVEAGRRYVAAYVDFIHYVEGLHQAASASSHAETESAGHQH